MIVGAILVSLVLTVPVRYEQKWLAAPYQRQWMTYGLFVLIAVLRSYSSLGDVAETCINTYNQQIQAAQFVHRYYYRAGVSLNEIGAVSLVLRRPQGRSHRNCQLCSAAGQRAALLVAHLYRFA